VTFMKALDLLHRAMHRTAMAIEMASNGGTLLFDQNVAKPPCFSPFKLTPSYYINLIGVISLFVSYWPLPLTMKAVLAADEPDSDITQRLV